MSSVNFGKKNIQNHVHNNKHETNHSHNVKWSKVLGLNQETSFNTQFMQTSAIKEAIGHLHRNSFCFFVNVFRKLKYCPFAYPAAKIFSFVAGLK